MARLRVLKRGNRTPVTVVRYHQALIALIAHLLAIMCRKSYDRNYEYRHVRRSAARMRTSFPQIDTPPPPQPLLAAGFN